MSENTGNGDKLTTFAVRLRREPHNMVQQHRTHTRVF